MRGQPPANSATALHETVAQPPSKQHHARQRQGKSFYSRPRPILCTSHAICIRRGPLHVTRSLYPMSTRTHHAGIFAVARSALPITALVHGAVLS